MTESSTRHQYFIRKKSQVKIWKRDHLTNSSIMGVVDGKFKIYRISFSRARLLFRLDNYFSLWDNNCLVLKERVLFNGTFSYETILSYYKGTKDLILSEAFGNWKKLLFSSYRTSKNLVLNRDDNMKLDNRINARRIENENKLFTFSNISWWVLFNLHNKTYWGRGVQMTRYSYVDDRMLIDKCLIYFS